MWNGSGWSQEGNKGSHLLAAPLWAGWLQCCWQLCCPWEPWWMREVLSGGHGAEKGRGKLVSFPETLCLHHTFVHFCIHHSPVRCKLALHPGLLAHFSSLASFILIPLTKVWACCLTLASHPPPFGSLGLIYCVSVNVGPVLGGPITQNLNFKSLLATRTTCFWGTLVFLACE